MKWCVSYILSSILMDSPGEARTPRRPTTPGRKASPNKSRGIQEVLTTGGGVSRDGKKPVDDMDKRP